LKNRLIIKVRCDNTRKEFNLYSLDYLGPEMAYSLVDFAVFLAIVDIRIRKAVYESLPDKVNFGSACHPTDEVGYGVQLGAITMLGASSSIH